MSESIYILKPQDLSEGETHKGFRSWAISLDKSICEAIKKGLQTAILVEALPAKIGLGDIVYLFEMNSGGKLACRFTITEMSRGDRSWIWAHYGEELYISRSDYWHFASKLTKVIRFEKVQEPTNRALYIEDFYLDWSPMMLTPVDAVKIDEEGWS